MQTVITYYKNLTRWDVKYFFAFNTVANNDFVDLKKIIKRYIEPINKRKQKEMVTKLI